MNQSNTSARWRSTAIIITACSALLTAHLVGCGSGGASNSSPGDEQAASQHTAKDDAPNSSKTKSGDNDASRVSASDANNKPPTAKDGDAAAVTRSDANSERAENNARSVDIRAQPERQRVTSVEPDVSGLSWDAALARRIAAHEQRRQVVDRIVLVPDAATYLDEIGQWTADRWWPVLFEDHAHTPLFVRRFAAQQVVRRSPVNVAPVDGEMQWNRITNTIVRTWGGDPAADDVRSTFAAAGHRPAGVVMTAVDDPAWTAAVALAAGRGQLIAQLPGWFGKSNQRLNVEATEKLFKAVVDGLDTVSEDYDELGDAIETITICRELAARGQVHLNERAQKPTVIALMDLIGRDRSSWERYAFGGWIFGSHGQSAYQAMCAMFFEQDRAWLANTYPDNGTWARYAMDKASAELGGMGLSCEAPATNELDRAGWYELQQSGVDADLIMLNSKGNADFFDVAADNAHMGFNDVPMLRSPVALAMVHSFSLQRPVEGGTVGGQWFQRGVYAYVGSVDEPYLSAFIQPGIVSERLAVGVPLLIAARHWQSRMSVGLPWKVTTIGDPLMTIGPSKGGERLTPDDREGLAPLPTREALMQTAGGSGGAIALDNAIRDASLLGDDEAVIALWRRVMGSNSVKIEQHAHRALPALYRSGGREAFVEAWQHISEPTHIEKTMLWHLYASSLGKPLEPSEVTVLIKAVREPGAIWDLERIAGQVRRAFGEQRVRELVNAQIAKTPQEHLQQRLRRILR